MANNPTTNNTPIAQASPVRINNLSPILDEQINLSLNLAADDPAQTYRLSLLQLRDFFADLMFPVGSIISRFDSQSPNAVGYGGTWERVPADMKLHSAAADNSDLNTVTGDNNPLVPIVLHNHTQNAHSHTTPAHSHGAGSYKVSATGGISSTVNGDPRRGVFGGASGVFSLTDPVEYNYSDGSNTARSGGVNFNLNATATGTSATASPTTNTTTGINNPEGTENARLDVRGKSLNVVFWKRIS